MCPMSLSSEASDVRQLGDTAGEPGAGWPYRHAHNRQNVSVKEGALRLWLL